MTLRSIHNRTSDRIAAARDGQEWAWDQIYGELAGPVTGYLRGHGAVDADDLASEVFLQLARNIGRFSGNEEQFRSWVFVIAHRRLIDSRRAQSRRPATDGGVEHLDPHGGNVEEEGLDALSLERVQAILDELTPSQRQVLTLRVIGDLSLEQAAKVMGKRVGAVKAVQRRALDAVKARLDEGTVSL